MSATLQQRVQLALRTVLDFPQPGIRYADITPILSDPELLSDVLQAMTAPFLEANITHVAAIESRGFLFGPSIALALKAKLAIVRKPGRLPWHTVREEYDLEYGTDVLEVHQDAFAVAARVLIVDDILATGGTIAAASRLVTRLDATVVGATFLGEISGLGGRARLHGITIFSVVET